MVLVCLKHISLIKKNYVGNCKNTSNLKKIPHYYSFLVSGCGVATRGWMAGNYRTAWLTWLGASQKPSISRTKPRSRWTSTRSCGAPGRWTVSWAVVSLYVLIDPYWDIFVIPISYSHHVDFNCTYYSYLRMLRFRLEKCGGLTVYTWATPTASLLSLW